MATRAGSAWDSGQSTNTIATQRGLGPSQSVRRGSVGSPTGPTTTTEKTTERTTTPVAEEPQEPQQPVQTQNNGTPQDQWNQSWMRTGGINPSDNWMNQNRSTGQNTSATPQYFNSQPGANDIQSYYNSRGIAPQGNSVQYWSSKYPELVARGRQLDPSSDGTWYFNKFLSNAEEFTGGRAQTAYNMWGGLPDPHPGDDVKYGNNGVGPSVPPPGMEGMNQQLGGGVNEQLLSAFMDYLSKQNQPQVTQPLQRPTTRKSDTQIRMGM